MLLIHLKISFQVMICFVTKLNYKPLIAWFIAEWKARYYILRKQSLKCPQYCSFFFLLKDSHDGDSQMIHTGNTKLKSMKRLMSRTRTWVVLKMLDLLLFLHDHLHLYKEQRFVRFPFNTPSYSSLITEGLHRHDFQGLFIKKAVWLH